MYGFFFVIDDLFDGTRERAQVRVRYDSNLKTPNFSFPITLLDYFFRFIYSNSSPHQIYIISAIKVFLVCTAGAGVSCLEIFDWAITKLDGAPVRVVKIVQNNTQ